MPGHTAKEKAKRAKKGKKKAELTKKQKAQIVHGKRALRKKNKKKGLK